MSVSNCKKWFFAYSLSLLSGSLFALSFPRPAFYLLAWIAFVPLFFAISNQKPIAAFLFGWTAGLVYFSGTLFWVTISMTEYGGLSWPASVSVMWLLVMYLALYVGFFAALVQYCAKGDEKDLLFFTPVLWVVLEWIKGHFLTGFPWASLAYSQTGFLPVIQIADFGSIYSVGFVMVLFNRAVYLMLKQGLHQGVHLREMRWKPLLIGVSVLLLTLLYGVFRLSRPSGDEKKLTVSVIQGNIAQDQKWDRVYQDQTIKTYERLSLSILETSSPKPSLIVWPEAALPFIFRTEPGYEKMLHDLVREHQFNLLFGAPSMKMEASGEITLLNSAYLLSPGKQTVSRYDKMHLVPFGEYVPFSEVLFFIQKLVEGVGRFVPGQAAVVFEIEGVKIGTVICFEVIFPELVRRFVKNGAVFMSTITNDAWFADSSAPYQHFSMVVFRAIENRVPFVRAANTGISGFVDAQGRILWATGLFVEAAATASLPLGNRRTLYTQFGDFFAALCGIIAVIYLCIVFVYSKK